MPKDPLEEEISRFLAAWLGARQIIQAANFNRFQREGLSATQFMTLNLLPVDGRGLTLSALAERLNLGLASLTRTVDSLESRGMLTRSRSMTDRRAVSIALTGKGMSLQNAASTEFQGHMEGLFRAMKPGKRAGLIEGLEALVQAGQPTREGDDAPPRKRSSRRSLKQ